MAVKKEERKDWVIETTLQLSLLKIPVLFLASSKGFGYSRYGGKRK
jgi:hypothetical protein